MRHAPCGIARIAFNNFFKGGRGMKAVRIRNFLNSLSDLREIGRDLEKSSWLRVAIVPIMLIFFNIILDCVPPPFKHFSSHAYTPHLSVLMILLGVTCGVVSYCVSEPNKIWQKVAIYCLPLFSGILLLLFDLLELGLAWLGTLTALNLIELAVYGLYDKKTVAKGVMITSFVLGAIIILIWPLSGGLKSEDVHILRGGWFYNVDEREIRAATSAEAKIDGLYATHVLRFSIHSVYIDDMDRGRDIIKRISHIYENWKIVTPGSKYDVPFKRAIVRIPVYYKNKPGIEYYVYLNRSNSNNVNFKRLSSQVEFLVSLPGGDYSPVESRKEGCKGEWEDCKETEWLKTITILPRFGSTEWSLSPTRLLPIALYDWPSFTVRHPL